MIRLIRLQPSKLVLAVRMWRLLLWTVLMTRRRALPVVVERLAHPARRPVRGLAPRRLSRINYRVLRIGPWRPRCLHRALVHFWCLRQQGDAAELVIGLPEAPAGKDAHAWVELDGLDVGPPPGRADHIPLVRYPGPESTTAQEAHEGA